LFGGFFGAQKQWGNWVLGIEGDIDGANIKGSGTSSAVSKYALYTDRGVNQLTYFTLGHDVSIETKVDMLASLRGKIGWAFAPNWMVYGTGGAAFAHVKNTLTESFSFEEVYNNIMVVCDPGTSNSASAGTSMFGWAAGAGLDYKWQIDQGSALVFGVEYLHYGFPEQTITLADNAGSSFAFTAKENVDVVKGRISYLFSIH
jgi:outer membrane immunogenic protein